MKEIRSFFATLASGPTSSEVAQFVRSTTSSVASRQFVQQIKEEEANQQKVDKIIRRIFT